VNCSNDERDLEDKMDRNCSTLVSMAMTDVGDAAGKDGPRGVRRRCLGKCPGACRPVSTARVAAHCWMFQPLSALLSR
jgi:hypothetical protein